MVFEIPLTRKTLAWFLGGLVAMVLVFYYGHRTPLYIEPKVVWKVAEREARTRDLDPRLVFALAVAESSLNARAESDVARGMMQMSEGTWYETTDRPYRDAFDWRACVAVAADHLVDLRTRLRAAGQEGTAPQLAAAYRYGYYALERQRFVVSKLRKPRNKVYRELFRGRIPEPTEFGV